MPVAVAQRVDFDRAPDLLAREHADEVVRAGDGGAVERKDDVARAQICALRRTARLDTRNHHGVLLCQSGGVPAPARERELLGRNADIGAPDATVTHELTEHEI